jgi:hypothetical protein
MKAMTTLDLENFVFVSEGKHGRILKGVSFMPTGSPTIFNMVFGDIEPDKKLNHFAVSNNGDRNKILATLARIIIVYTDKYPNRSILLIGSTIARNRLYRMAISLNLEELSEKFEIEARENENSEFVPFQKNITATSFLIKRKF